MTFIKPMLGSPLPENFKIEPDQWVVEEKLDGHRLIASVAETGGDLFGNPTVRAWSRYGIERILPRHIRTVLEVLPSGIYDGELLVPGTRSYGVTELTNTDKLVYIVFDALEVVGKSMLNFSYEVRRGVLEKIFRDKQPLINAFSMGTRRPAAVQIAWSQPISSWDELRTHAIRIWERDGEGLIVKLRSSPYVPDKRTKSWLKVKQLRSAVLTIIGYRAGKLGPQATVLLRDEEGNETTVKALNNEERAALEARPADFIGRRLAIEYQERTPDGNYRHPRWDHWAREDE